VRYRDCFVIATNIFRASSRDATDSKNAIGVPFIPSAVRTRTTNPRRSQDTMVAPSASA